MNKRLAKLKNIQESNERILGENKNHKKSLKEWSDEDMAHGEEDFDDDWYPPLSDEDKRRDRETQDQRDKLERARNGEEIPEDFIGLNVIFTLEGKKYRGHIKSVFKENDGTDIFVVVYANDEDGIPRLSGLTKDRFTIDNR